MTASKPPVVVAPVALAALVLAGPLSCTSVPGHDPASHDRGKHDHSVGGHPARPAPVDRSAAAATTARDYADAVRQLRARLASLDAIIKSGDYDAVHADCVAAGTLADSLGALAVAPGSPVPKDKVAAVTSAGQELASAARSLHSAAHADDLVTVKADRTRMGQLLESLARYVPQP